MKLVITRHRPVRNTLISIVLLGSVVLALGIAMDYGHWKSIARAMVSTGEKRSLLEEVVALRRENETLHFEVAQMRRAAEVNRHAGKDNHQQLVRLQSDAAALKSEVDFYRDVVGTTEVDTGPRVKGLKIKTLEGDGRYRYKLVITHVNKDDRMAEGELTFDIRGELNGQGKTFAYPEVVESGPDSLTFKFKHFHLFEGTLRMPAGFVARQVHLTVTEKSRRKGNHTKTYEWPSVVD